MSRITNEPHPIEDVYSFVRPRGFVSVDLPASYRLHLDLKGIAHFKSTNAHQCLSDMLHHGLLHTDLNPTVFAPRRQSRDRSYLVSKRVAALLDQRFPGKDRRRLLQKWLLWLVRGEVDLIAVAGDVTCLCGCGIPMDPLRDSQGRAIWVAEGHSYYLRPEDQQRPREKRVFSLLQRGPMSAQQVAQNLGQDLEGTRTFLCELTGLNLLQRVEKGVYGLASR